MCKIDLAFFTKVEIMLNVPTMPTEIKGVCYTKAHRNLLYNFKNKEVTTDHQQKIFYLPNGQAHDFQSTNGTTLKNKGIVWKPTNTTPIDKT